MSWNHSSWKHPLWHLSFKHVDVVPFVAMAWDLSLCVCARAHVCVTRFSISFPMMTQDLKVSTSRLVPVTHSIILALMAQQNYWVFSRIMFQDLLLAYQYQRVLAFPSVFPQSGKSSLGQCSMSVYMAQRHWITETDGALPLQYVIKATIPIFQFTLCVCL